MDGMKRHSGLFILNNRIYLDANTHCQLVHVRITALPHSGRTHSLTYFYHVTIGR